MINYIACYEENGEFVGAYLAPFDVEIDCYTVVVYGDNYSEMKLRGKCNRITFGVSNFNNNSELIGFMDLEIGEVILDDDNKSMLKVLDINCRGLLKILELNCKRIKNVRKNDRKIYDIINKYLEEEDPLMRDFEGFKLEMAVNGYGNRL